MPKSKAQNESNLRYYHRNREKNIAWQKQYREKVKDLCFMAYGGYVCKCCAETEPTMLTLDHINNDGYKHRKEIGHRGGIGQYLWIIRNDYPPMFQVYCASCNQSKRMNGGVCIHQTKERSTILSHSFEQSGPGDSIMEMRRPDGHAHLDQKLDKGMRSPWVGQLPMDAGLESPATSGQSGSGHGDSGYTGGGR